MSRFQASEAARLYWRVYVHPVDGSTSPRALSWHLAACSDPENPDAHCMQGRAFLAANGDPDGHCRSDGACSRCAMLGFTTQTIHVSEHRLEVSPHTPIDVIPLAPGQSLVDAS